MCWKNLQLTILFLGIFLSDSFCQVIDRGPYLQSVSQESIFIKWRTETATDSKIWFGDSPSNLNQTISSASSVTDHELFIDGLTTNTLYYYAVGNNNGQLVGGDENHFFRTSPDTTGNQNIKIWVLGDPGTANSNQRAVRDAYYDDVTDEFTDGILLLGDNAYSDGTQSEYQYALFENMYEEKLINTVLWSTFGNHDGNSANSNTQTGPYYDIFTFPTNGEIGGVASGTEAYFSFDYGNVHFISMNSDDVDATPNSDMIQWLENDLEVNTQEWIVAFWHHSPYTGEGGNESDFKISSIEMRENVVPILEAGGTDLVLTGHTHAYQRSFFMRGHYDVSSTWDPDSMALDLGDGRLDGDGAFFKERGSEGIGTIYMNAGSSGKLDYDDYNHPAMNLSIEKLGSVIIDVSGLQMDVKFLDSDGIIQDYFTILKMVDPPIVDITYPHDFEYFPTPEDITITAEASDSNGSVTQVEFFIDNTSIGIDSIEPYEVDWSIPANGNYRIKVVATDNDGYYSTDFVSVNVGIINVCSRVDSSSDDAEEREDGSLSLTSSDLEMVYDGEDQKIGIRFNNLNIPQCSQISNAFIQFTDEETTNINPCELQIFAEDNDNPSTFLDVDHNISNRQKTTTSVLWSPPDWNNPGESGPNQKTVDLSSIIQEVVNREGFSESSSIVILIEGTGKRTAESFDGELSLAPRLCLDYIPIGVDSDNDGVCDALDQCPGSPEPGMPCDDGDPNTTNDTVNSNCECEGEQIYDCPGLQLNIGDSCDDGDPNTSNDTVNLNCECEGEQIYDCPGLQLNIGDSCDDGDPNTSNDTVNSNCECEGEQIYDCPGLQLNIGDSCDDGNPNTSNDTVNSNCECEGEQIYDCPGLQLNIGDSCDDGDPNTSNDTVNSNCECEGEQIYDCPGLQLNIGDSCDDGNPNTTNDTVNSNCECEGEQIYDCPGLQLNIGDSCDDGNPNTSNDTVNSNCECEGEQIYDCPGLQLNIGEACDDDNPDTSDDVINENCECVGSSIITVIVNNSSDDAEEMEDGQVDLTSNDLELVEDGSQNQLVGIRFSGLGINQGALIDSAYIQFTTDETNNYDPCTLHFYGEAVDDPLTFSSSYNNISSRPKTMATAVWTPDLWNTIDESGTFQRTIDIAPIVQEIVNRDGFNANSGLAILIEGEGRRVAVSYDGNIEKAPKLIVKFKNSVVGINNEPVSESIQLTVYPVPTRDQLNISFNSLTRQKVPVKIIDLNGRELLSISRQVEVGENNILIQNLDLSSGIYFIQLKINNSIQSAKFSILR